MKKRFIKCGNRFLGLAKVPTTVYRKLVSNDAIMQLPILGSFQWKRKVVSSCCFGIALLNILAANQYTAFLPANKPCLTQEERRAVNIYTQLSLLYWECRERGLEFALDNVGPQQSSKMTSHSPDFKWSPAFRCILGYRLPLDNWSIDLGYAFFLEQTHSSCQHPSTNHAGNGLLAVFASGATEGRENTFLRWQEAQARWKMQAHFVDLMLRHNLWNGYAVSFQPAWGLKVAQFSQTYATSYLKGFYTVRSNLAFNQTSVEMKSDSFNIGPEFECASQWYINKHWNIFGSVSGALVASSFDVDRHEMTTLTQANKELLYAYHDTYWTYRPQGSLLFGIEWHGCYCRTSSVLHYGLSLSYEAQYWWKQNMFLRHYDSNQMSRAALAPSQGDLFFQGASINFLFDF